MFTQFYELNFLNEGYLNLTNVYKDLIIINNSSEELKVYYRTILVCKLPSNSSITLENIFGSGKKYDENIQLKFVSNSISSVNVHIINYGAIQK